MLPTKLTVRVYGIYINERNEVLLVDERIKGRSITKFPGGGMELGEGPADCLKREFLEETGQKVSITHHYYTTDFYIHSEINPEYQVVCIYYKIDMPHPDEVKAPASHQKLSFKFIPLSELSEEDVTFPSDKAVVSLLKQS